MGRYIDTEKIHITADLMTDEMGEIYVSLTDVRKSIDQTPTADVVEVRHGEWIDKSTGTYSRMQSWCSACGKHSGIGGIESNRHKPYCPNCGACMDGERKNNGN